MSDNLNINNERASYTQSSSPPFDNASTDTKDRISQIFQKTIYETCKKSTPGSLQPKYTMDLDISQDEVNTMIQERAHAPPIHPELVPFSSVRVPSAYKRLQDTDKKDVFRGNLLNGLRREWIKSYGIEKATRIEAQFKELSSILDQNGAVVFGELIPKESFEQLIACYTEILKKQGSKSWIHSYINLANHPDFLGDTKFNAAFLHPLLIALISYKIGGPIRIVDTRGKDAQPISVLAQDNMLHIDNTPFNDEYKIILTWEKDKPSGPKGQNFAFIPGTHQGVRNCFVDEQGNAWSTENGSIFVTEESIQKVFDFQKTVLPNESPMVIETQHPDKPLTAVFAAGSLVHHRYRTEEGFARSCIILAFHRAADNEGQLLPPNRLDQVSKQRGDLNSFLFGPEEKGKNEGFIEALEDNAKDIAIMLDHLETKEGGAELITQQKQKLSPTEIEKWKNISTHAPSVEDLKIEKSFFTLGSQLSKEEFSQVLGKMMLFDKHGPLDLILYGNGQEEIRKWARNQIREMRADHLESRLESWMARTQSPAPDQILSIEELKEISTQLAHIVEEEITLNHKAHLEPNEAISDRDAFRSIHRLILDLGEAITRCETRQTFLSTSLFLFWACDTLQKLEETPNTEVEKLGARLLSHYVATSILIEKQIRQAS